MNLATDFELIPARNLVLIKATAISQTASLISLPDKVAESSEWRFWRVEAVGPQFKAMEWGFDVGDDVLFIGQPIGHKGFPTTS